MQLKNKKSIAGALGSATCALLGMNVVAAEETSNWEVDTSLLYYSEADRVSAIEPAIFAKRTFDDTSILNLNFVFDSLSGASPNGAAPSDQPQTFTTPSGLTTYTTPAGETPLDPTFKDTRIQLGTGWDAPLGRSTRYNLGLNLSKEYDYSSIALSGGLAFELDRKNTVLSIGGSFASDTLSPEGGIPTPLASMAPPLTEQPREGSEDSRTVSDLMLGLSQVIGPNTLMRFNIGTSAGEGYLNDPYKIVSVIDAKGRPTDYIYESRPGTRRKNYLYWETNYHLPINDTINLSYRYLRDDWGINSHTLDFRYRWNIGQRWHLQPRLRLYSQSAADFYRTSIGQNEVNPGYISADYRLGDFNATTYGLKLGYTLDSGSELSARLETYQQRGNANPDDAVGVQKQYETFPDLNAYIFHINYGFKF